MATKKAKSLEKLEKEKVDGKNVKGGFSASKPVLVERNRPRFNTNNGHAGSMQDNFRNDPI